ncbi:DEAD/DEAH box helicase family protein [Aureibaculum luteum]|uniref:DEAD/DEAH box helicase family protein n=1 Tax=Aureibaculum luteum TaxID=1548456 RepID=UPI000E4C75A5|nr:DEAD/DEAH box helicase family protein [Aureibaculum luteum]
MIKFSTEKFEKSIQTGFINKSISSEVVYQPELLVNSKEPKLKILSTIIKELESCESFYISVAFVTTGGVATLMNTLISLEKRNIKGKILVSQYLNFTQPEALKRLLKFKNIELKIATKGNSHSKGYLFKTNKYYNLIIGSSNLTDNALTTNKEWNLKVSALNESEIVNKVVGEFEDDFKHGTKVTSQFIEAYKTIYDNQKLFNTLNETVQVSIKKIIPNSMQREALINLENLRLENKNKALLISATGTGKTYLSAFDAKAFNSKKLLFVVHRLNIAKKALKTFEMVFGDSKTMGLYSGNHRDLDKDFNSAFTIKTYSSKKSITNEGWEHKEIVLKANSFDDSYEDIVITEENAQGMTVIGEFVCVLN